MSKVFVNIGLSLDGYMAPEGMTMGNPEYKGWGAKWGALMAWIINQPVLFTGRRARRACSPSFFVESAWPPTKSEQPDG
ncbi:MAG: hypothetical protein ABI193_05420 [Minicystis sp.]